jgi:hypothetical protein
MKVPSRLGKDLTFDRIYAVTFVGAVTRPGASDGHISVIITPQILTLHIREKELTTVTALTVPNPRFVAIRLGSRTGIPTITGTAIVPTIFSISAVTDPLLRARRGVTHAIPYAFTIPIPDTTTYNAKKHPLP